MISPPKDSWGEGQVKIVRAWIMVPPMAGGASWQEHRRSGQEGQRIASHPSSHAPSHSISRPACHMGEGPCPTSRQPDQYRPQIFDTAIFPFVLKHLPKWDGSVADGSDQQRLR